MSDTTPAEQHEVQRDGGRPLRFKGWRIGRTKNSWDTAHPDYSGSTGRCQELRLYRTVSGKYVCQRIGYSQWQGERTRYEAEVCADLEAVMAFFGHGRLAKDLYEAADLDTAEEVD